MLHMAAKPMARGIHCYPIFLLLFPDQRPYIEEHVHIYIYLTA